MASPGLRGAAGRRVLGGMDNAPLRWGIVGTGSIAHKFAAALRETDSGRLVAVGSRGAESARRFAEEFGVGRAHGRHEDLLADPEVEAVYIATPHPAHAEGAIAAARAGKHVLCEKPLTLNLGDSGRVVAAAREAGVTLMEAFMYRCHPQTAKLAALVREGAIGQLGLVEASFGFHCDFMPGHRLFAKALGGGGILDVGGYPVSMARLLAGAALGRAFAEPLSLAGAGRLHPVEGTDLHAAATLGFEAGIVAQVSCGVSLAMENVVRVHGSAGSILVREPWFAGGPQGMASLRLRTGDGTEREVPVDAPKGLYVYEAEAFAAAVRAGQREEPAMSHGDTLGNMAVLDRWRAAVGVVHGAAGA